MRGSDDPRVGEQGGATLVLELPVLVLAQGHLYIEQFFYVIILFFKT